MPTVNIWVPISVNNAEFHGVLSGESPFTFNFPANQYMFPKTHDWIFFSWLQFGYGFRILPSSGYGNHRVLVDDQVFGLEQRVTLTAADGDSVYYFLHTTKKISSHGS